MSRLDCILVYQWRAWDGFLISHLVADYCCVQAQYDDCLNVLERRLSPNIRAVLPQINLTCSAQFPEHREQLWGLLAKRGIALMNSQVSDISKRQLQLMVERCGLLSLKANKDGPLDEVLFVKSNLNYGGQSERFLPEHLQTRMFGAAGRATLAWNEYYTSIRSSVAPAVWNDPQLVVERFVANAEGSFFRVYGFGDALVVVKAFSGVLIKKLSGDPRDSNAMLKRRELLEESNALPRGVRQLLHDFLLHYPLEYFCLDIVHDASNYFIADLNLTPWAGMQQQSAQAIEFLCRGALSFLTLHSERNRG